jgi:RNA polymerase sigma-70 factor (ECF subfamily)
LRPQIGKGAASSLFSGIILNFDPVPCRCGDYPVVNGRQNGQATTMTASASDSAINWPEALDQHGRWIRSVLRSRINDHHVVEDLFQDVSMAVFRQSSRPTDADKVAPWLYRLTIRQAINHYRRAGRRKRLYERLELGAATTAPETADALQWLVQTELSEAVRDALASLRPQDREVLVLKYTENWSYTELARHLGASSGTIEYRLIRAKKALRQQLIARNLSPLHS